MDSGKTIITDRKLASGASIFTITLKAPEIIDSKNSTECIEKGIYTFNNTGKKYCVQSS
jgi:hypothetical protein